MGRLIGWHIWYHSDLGSEKLFQRFTSASGFLSLEFVGLVSVKNKNILNCQVQVWPRFAKTKILKVQFGLGSRI